LPDQHRLIDIITAAIKMECKAQGGKRPVSARLKISELASVTPQVVQFCFDRTGQKDGLDGIRLDIQIVPLLGECAVCERVVEIDSVLRCKRCGKPYVTIGDHNMILLESCEFA